MNNKISWLQKLDRKFGRFAIRNLMLLIVCGMGIVFLMDLSSPVYVSQLLVFDKVEIMNGQFWRIISFIFIPPDSSIIFIVISLYFYWLLGSSLENEWGSFKFNIFYLCGIIETIIAGTITGYATNMFVNLSLFFAFAILFPNYQILLFFILPIKVKYLALIDAVFFIYMFINATWQVRIAILISLFNLILFFWRDAKDIIQQAYRKTKWKNSMRK